MPDSYVYIWLLNGNTVQAPLEVLETLEHHRRCELATDGEDRLIEIRDVFGSEVSIIASFIAGWHTSTPATRLAVSLHVTEEDC
jgi:hypothetical protein